MSPYYQDRLNRATDHGVIAQECTNGGVLDGYLRRLEGDSVCRSMRRLIAMSAHMRPSRGFEFRPVRKWN